MTNLSAGAFCPACVRSQRASLVASPRIPSKKRTTAIFMQLELQRTGMSQAQDRAIENGAVHQHYLCHCCKDLVLTACTSVVADVTLSVPPLVQDRFCGAVHIRALPEFPCFVLSALDADIARLQQGVSGVTALTVGVDHTEHSCAVPPHVCNSCVPSLVSTEHAAALQSLDKVSLHVAPAPDRLKLQADITTGILQECAASQASLAVERVHSIKVPQASASDQDSAKQRTKVYQAAATALKTPSTEGSHPKSGPQQLPDHYSVGQAARPLLHRAGDMQGLSATFVADHDSSKKFDIMEWFMSSRSFVPPPCLPKCMPIFTHSACIQTQQDVRLGSVKSVHGGARGSEKYGQQHATKGRSALTKATHPDHEVSFHSTEVIVVGCAHHWHPLPMEWARRRFLVLHAGTDVSFRYR